MKYSMRSIFFICICFCSISISFNSFGFRYGQGPLESLMVSKCSSEVNEKFNLFVEDMDPADKFNFELFLKIKVGGLIIEKIRSESSEAVFYRNRLQMMFCDVLINFPLNAVIARGNDNDMLSEHIYKLESIIFAAMEDDGGWIKTH